MPAIGQERTGIIASMHPQLTFLLFQIGGVALVAHIILSQVLRVIVGWNSPLAIELFAVTSVPSIPVLGFRLFNARYFLPWVPSPIDMQAQSFPTGLVFWLTRITGAIFPLAILSSFAGAFAIAAK